MRQDAGGSDLGKLSVLFQVQGSHEEIEAGDMGQAHISEKPSLAPRAEVGLLHGMRGDGGLGWCWLWGYRVDGFTGGIHRGVAERDHWWGRAQHYRVTVPGLSFPRSQEGLTSDEWCPHCIPIARCPEVLGAATGCERSQQAPHKGPSYSLPRPTSPSSTPVL